MTRLYFLNKVKYNKEWKIETKERMV